MISIVTGTLNRIEMVTSLVSNTINRDNRLELVIVDGGSTDGTIELIKEWNIPQIKLIEVGGRSSYPHFMNLGIQNASNEWICQWNDDVVLINTWSQVIEEIENDEHDFYLFNWKYGSYDDIRNSDWVDGFDHTKGWCLCNESSSGGEIVMNYGLYNKRIFREIGMYNLDYRYYCADGDMASRAYNFGYRCKDLRHIKVCSLPAPKKAIPYPDDNQIYKKYIQMYKDKKLPDNIQYL
jgi:glycosyltransferase involved in cell wall biosynthesis